MKTLPNGRIEVLHIGNHISIVRDGEYSPMPINAQEYQRRASELYRAGDKMGALGLVASMEKEGILSRGRVDRILDQMTD